MSVVISICLTDVLVIPKRVVPRVADLTGPEAADLMCAQHHLPQKSGPLRRSTYSSHHLYRQSAQSIGRVIEREFKASSLTFAIQVRPCFDCMSNPVNRTC